MVLFWIINECISDDGAFYIGVQWNAPITHDAAEIAYSQWKLELLSVDLQSCNCSSQVCAIGPQPKPDNDDPSNDKLKTVLAAVGGSLAAVLLIAVVCYCVRKQRPSNEQQEPLVKRSVQTTGQGAFDP